MPLLPAEGRSGPQLIGRKRLADDRGHFSRLFCAEELAEAGWTGPVAQVNHSVTGRAGTVRGLHLQRPPHAEMKLVSCIRGAVFDVAVDLRPGSPTRFTAVAAELSAENGLAMLVPEGFAHGFQALCDGCELIYLHSAGHSPGSEAGLRHDDPALAIAWPLPVALVSERDAGLPSVAALLAEAT
ncbi:dTDP-4-dehydrorhamnose 3,5-epimerase family protein [Hoeflea marina]|nr:dTDP-4-dehydrorhamnose 3,5-epimerase [Hoeflea marina]